jgi:hypothetical protein
MEWGVRSQYLDTTGKIRLSLVLTLTLMHFIRYLMLVLSVVVFEHVQSEKNADKARPISINENRTNKYFVTLPLALLLRPNSRLEI